MFYSKHELSYDSWLKSMAYSLKYWYFSLADHAFWVEYLEELFPFQNTWQLYISITLAITIKLAAI